MINPFQALLNRKVPGVGPGGPPSIASMATGGVPGGWSPSGRGPVGETFGHHEPDTEPDFDTDDIGRGLGIGQAGAQSIPMSAPGAAPPGPGGRTLKGRLLDGIGAALRKYSTY